MTTSLDPIATLVPELRSLLAKGAAEATRRGEALLVSTTSPAPSIDTVAVFERADGRERAFWAEPMGRLSMVAVGEAARLTGHGDERFARVAAGWHRLIGSAITALDDSCPIATPICIGGFAFDASATQSGPWQRYGDARFVVPACLAVSHGDASWLTVSALVEPGDDPDAIADGIEAMLREMLAPSGRAAPKGSPRLDLGPQMDAGADRWMKTVRSAVAGIERGELQKLVLARQVRVHSTTAIDAGTIVRRLLSGYGDSTVFAVAQGESCFLGATPERLVRVDGAVVEAPSVAGSIARGATEDEDRALGAALLADTKERHEHALVVAAIAQTLAPVCSELRVPEAPELLRLPDVQHLSTPIDGVLKGKLGVLDLVERLHPTPAVGGVPREVALSRIREYEPFDRGWYAGPVGWVDRKGGGDFVVAIRSALVSGSEALLYAGCGLVRDSLPEREYDETRLKLRSMLWALSGG